MRTILEVDEDAISDAEEELYGGFQSPVSSEQNMNLNVIGTMFASDTSRMEHFRVPSALTSRASDASTDPAGSVVYRDSLVRSVSAGRVSEMNK